MNKKLFLAAIACSLSIAACSKDSDVDKAAMQEAAKEMSDHAKQAKQEMSKKMTDKAAEMKMDTMQKKLLSEADLKALEDNDPYRWLEEVEGKKALEWVEARNKTSLEHLRGLSAYQTLHKKNLALFNSKERIDYPDVRNGYVYNFLQDDDHSHGLWRRTSLDTYKALKPEWETLLDVDALAKTEGENWVYKGSNCLAPDYTRCILTLSRGGTDAAVRREFDLTTKQFITDGFNLEESKGSIAWLDKNSALVGINFGDNTMTDSGYPRLTKLWKRGTALADAQTIFEAEQTDVGVWPFTLDGEEQKYAFISQSDTYFTRSTYYFKDGNVNKLGLPDDIDIEGMHKDQLLLLLQSDWNVNNKEYKQGSLISISFAAFLAGERNFTTIFEPSDRSSISDVESTKDSLLLSVLNNVRGELYRYQFADGKWSKSSIETPKLGTLTIVATDGDSDQFFYAYESFLSPTTLFLVDNTGQQHKISSLSEAFDAQAFKVEQAHVLSKDGTKIPYFLLSKKDIKTDGSNPTILYGYGGFKTPLVPKYAAQQSNERWLTKGASIGINWLEQGGVYAIANTRGGGEFGPKWHQAALKENRMRAFEDFIAVSEDLIRKNITSPKHLGIIGRSNGGLLTGAAYTLRPDLYSAVVSWVPLLDMKRYNKLLAGASWMAEFGNPDIPEEWDYIKDYSPYHNLEKDKKYPKVFLATSTKDDRVHPAHARKMAALMDEYGHSYYYYENTQGGHAGTANNDEMADMYALVYGYFSDQLMPKTK